MAMLSVLLVVLTGIFNSTLDVKLESESISNVEEDGRFITAKLIYDINRAESITLPANLGDTSSTLAITVDGVSETFSLTNGNMEITKNGILDVLNGFDTTVSNLSFQRLGKANGKNSIKIIFTVTSITQRAKGPEIKTFETTAAIR